jgi:hypothetical protein
VALLTGQNILTIWEAGQFQHPLDRAITIIAGVCPDLSRDSLASLTIGQRDAFLLELREQLSGPHLDGYIECRRCRERLEFGMTVADLRAATSSEAPATDTYPKLEEGEWEVTFRVPDSFDLAEAIGAGDLASGRAVLIQRCVLTACRNGAVVAAGELPEEIVAKLAGRMAQCDPDAEILLHFDCPSCHCEWQESFDIVSFFWTEIAARAKRLLREVHTLARAYGWREADILAMNPARRNSYLEMVGG